MTARKVVTPTPRVRIEQAIARGLTASRIAAVLDVDIDLVHEVWDDLDEINEQDNARGLMVEKRQRRDVTYSAELARERDVVGINAAKARDARSLLEQVVDAPRGRYCGSRRAYVRHLRRWEPIDPLCRLAARDYQRVQRRVERARKKAA